MKKSVKIIISGKVHGVGFRYGAVEKASEFGIAGYVRNMPMGKLYIEAEGLTNQLEKFINWCKQGPEQARIDSFEQNNNSFFGHRNFSVRF